jgi:hypothetical protein
MLVMQYEPPEEILNYLKDMRDAMRHALEVAYEMVIVNRVPSSIDVRNGIKPWELFFTSGKATIIRWGHGPVGWGPATGTNTTKGLK